MTSNGGAGYSYNAESQLKTTAGVTYIYDGDGNRVKKSNGKMYWGSGPLEESDLTGAVQREFIFADGKRIARRDITGGLVYYYFTDHLGSTDVVTNANGAIQNDSDYFPYGGERVYSSALTQTYKFTGKERDSESGLDNFGFRYYGSSLGRFMKPDNGSAQDSGNPQSWNLYSYVMNQPTTATDPDGHDCIYVDSDSGKMTGFNRGDCDNSTEEKANSGIYVNGTVDSFHYDKASGSLDYGYTDENGNAGVGTILGVTPPKLGPMDNGAVTPGMLGPGDLILFSGVKTPSFVTDALGKVLGSIFGKTVEETGAAVEEIVAKAGSSVGNQSIKASSRAAAEEAAEKWVGAGARPIMREGEQVGFVSADGTKVARWTSAGKPDPYINLTNNTTGGNLHVHF